MAAAAWGRTCLSNKLCDELRCLSEPERCPFNSGSGCTPLRFFSERFKPPVVYRPTGNHGLNSRNSSCPPLIDKNQKRGTPTQAVPRPQNWSQSPQRQTQPTPTQKGSARKEKARSAGGVTALRVSRRCAFVSDEKTTNRCQRFAGRKVPRRDTNDQVSLEVVFARGNSWKSAREIGFQ